MLECPDCHTRYAAKWGHPYCIKPEPVRYDGDPCTTCGQPTVWFQVAAPGYGRGQVCSAGHHAYAGAHGILTPEDVR